MCEAIGVRVSVLQNPVVPNGQLLHLIFSNQSYQSA